MIDQHTYEVLSEIADGKRKTKPVGRFMLFMMQLAEPIQYVYLGGSNMAWVRFMAEVNHRFGHSQIRMGGDPEEKMTVMTDEEFWKKSKKV